MRTKFGNDIKLKQFLIMNA